jgi:hypothetical protein
MRRDLHLLAFVLGCTAALASSSAALAVDGVIEINQALALAGQVSPYDFPGFPVLIRASGSYRLTGNLTVPAIVLGIEVYEDATDVTIDLNGFEITGPVTCSSSPPLTCTPITTGAGIWADGDAPGSRLRVVNGTVRGFGNGGINGGNTDLTVQSVHVANNGGFGIASARSVVVIDSVIDHNGGHGISGADASLVRGCDVNYNGSYSSELGIYVAKSAMIVNNNVNYNSGGGIFADNGGTIIGNTVNANVGDGIAGGSGLTVVNNTARSNTGFGIHIATGGYGGNVLTNNNGGDAHAQVSGGLEIGTNVCGTNLTCP